MHASTDKTALLGIPQQHFHSKDMNNFPAINAGSNMTSQNPKTIMDTAMMSTNLDSNLDDSKPSSLQGLNINNNGGRVVIGSTIDNNPSAPLEIDLTNDDTDMITTPVQIVPKIFDETLKSGIGSSQKQNEVTESSNSSSNENIVPLSEDISQLKDSEMKMTINSKIENNPNKTATESDKKEVTKHETEKLVQDNSVSNPSVSENDLKAIATDVDKTTTESGTKPLVQDSSTPNSLNNSQNLSGEKRDLNDLPLSSRELPLKKMKGTETEPGETQSHPDISLKQDPMDTDPQQEPTLSDSKSIDPQNKPPLLISNEKIDPIPSSNKTEGNQSESKAQDSTNVLSNKSPEKEKELDEDFTSLVTLDTIPEVERLPLLCAREFAELELALQIGDKFTHGEDNYWRDDWGGNLQLIDKDLLMNKDKMVQNPGSKPVLLPFCEWVAKTSQHPNDFRAVRLLFSHISNIKGTPEMAKKIMAYSLKRPASTVEERLNLINEAVRRISYDPVVLRQDGWTTKKADSPEGLSGGSYLIGRRVIWHRYEAVIIAYVKDEEIGDLWKAMWVEDQETFDLEADELQEALTKWDKKNMSKQKKSLEKRSAKVSNGSNKPVSKPAGSVRFEATRNFTVDGIETGIVLATSYSARNGVPWPARVMHSSEVKALGTQSSSRRSSSKNEIHVVFLAPYWNGQYSQSFRNKGNSNNVNAEAKNMFSTGDLLELETIDVSEDTIQKYPFEESEDTISIDKIRSAFSFLCLPKSAFSRFLDSHRLALAFKSFAKRNLGGSSNSVQSNSSRTDAFASLTDCHPLAVQTYLFPSVILNLPYTYLLGQLPHPNEKLSQLVGDGEEMTEPVLQLHIMLKAMTTPLCWGKGVSDKDDDIVTNEIKEMIPATPLSKRRLTPIKSPSVESKSENMTNDIIDKEQWALSNFASEYLLNLMADTSGSEKTECTVLLTLGNNLRVLLSRIQNDFKMIKSSDDNQEQKEYIRSIMLYCLSTKGHGEDVLLSGKIPNELNVRNIMIEWRKACERIFKFVTKIIAAPGIGNGVTSVFTDYRCNQHLTAVGSYERAIRVPAAVRGAKMAGAGSMANFPLITKIDGKYMDFTEKKVLPMAHKSTYLNRMKKKIAALPPDTRGAPLTDDSEGEGGEDTVGSRGSYTAALAAVAAAIQGVDMIISGQITNAFCAVRPPGHHAGRELHAMNAISNGFCILNAAACASMYATTPQSDGGLGLKRVCVIDFDVHHGNGTQDILCSTYDPRFLYVSTHAGGAHINGFDDEDSDDAYRRSHGYSRCEGIFPGRCGDTSPHEGVLNIPLGMKVTAQSIGNALVSRVAPAVEAYSPDLIIISAGFDAHRNDPLGMGGLTAEDFGSVTSVICHMALKSCSGRVLSILEGGYGVPCCQPLDDLFLPKTVVSTQGNPIRLGNDLPEGMEDKVDPALSQKLEKCNQEGFIECVKEHVQSLAKYNNRSK